MKNFLDTRQGTNQYKKQYRLYGLKSKTWKSIIYILILLFIAMYLGFYGKLSEPIHIISPIPVNAYSMDVPTRHVVTLADAKTQEVSIAIIKKIWRKNWVVGVAIAKCESGLRQDAVNHNTDGTYDVGIFQINQVHAISQKNLENPYANAGYAYSLYIEQGTNPWYSSKRCWGN